MIELAVVVPWNSSETVGKRTPRPALSLKDQSALAGAKAMEAFGDQALFVRDG